MTLLERDRENRFSTISEKLQRQSNCEPFQEACELEMTFL